MISLLGTLATWSPVLLLLYVPRLVQELTGLLARHGGDGLDRAIPDELPMTAGEWLVDRIARLRHPIAALVTDRREDAYRPGDGVIQLHAQTYFKADPVYWAAAAHELGHARLHAEHPLAIVARRTAGWLRAGLIASGVGLTLGRVLYALPAAGALGLRCFALAAGTTIFTLIDEAAASAIAYRELRASPALTAVHRRAIARMLVTWFATYALTYAAYALLLRYWPLIDALAGDRGASASPLTGLARGAAMVATVGCASAMVWQLAWMLAPRSVARAGWGVVLEWASGVALVGLAWNHRVDATYAWCAMLALASSSRTWLAVIDLLLRIPHVLTRYVLSSCQSHGPERSERYLDAVQQGRALVSGGNDWLSRLDQQALNEPPWFLRLAALTALGYLPLIAALWLC